MISKQKRIQEIAEGGGYSESGTTHRWGPTTPKISGRDFEKLLGLRPLYFEGPLSRLKKNINKKKSLKRGAIASILSQRIIQQYFFIIYINYIHYIIYNICTLHCYSECFKWEDFRSQNPR